MAACGGGQPHTYVHTTPILRSPLVTATTADAAAQADDDAWLSVSKNHIVTRSGKPFHGRGANLHDPRSCDGCTYLPIDIAETERRADELIDGWKATLVRFDLESYASDAYPKGDHRVDGQWQSILNDPAYFSAIRTIVKHMTDHGAYVLVSEWLDPTITLQKVVESGPQNGDRRQQADIVPAGGDGGFEDVRSQLEFQRQSERTAQCQSDLLFRHFSRWTLRQIPEVASKAPQRRNPDHPGPLRPRQTVAGRESDF